MSTTTSDFFGTTTFGDPETIGFCPPGRPDIQLTGMLERGEWRPPDRIEEWLPDDFSLPIDCYTASDGVRRFVPRCNFDELIDVGFAGGLAVLQGTPRFSREHAQSYRAMNLIRQHLRGRAHLKYCGMQERHRREFNYSRDLYVRRLSRVADDERDVLPDDIGLNSSGAGCRLSVKQLADLGRNAAREAGYDNPTNSVAIAHGLYEAARRNPLKLKQEEVPALVRRGLFDLSDTQHPGQDVMNIVNERLLAAINRHQGDTQEEFDHWFLSSNNSLVKQIAKQKKNGGELTRDEVRHSLLELGWQSYSYVEQCVHALMHTIENSLGDSLTEKEKRLFEVMHASQPAYGGFPLALLAERSSTIELAISDIWTEPGNPQHVLVLHRLLAYYGEMAEKRRQADRRAKLASAQGGKARDNILSSDDGDEQGNSPEPAAVGEAERETPGENDPAWQEVHFSPADEGDSPFADIAEAVRVDRGLTCPACARWEYCLESHDNDTVTFGVRCDCGRVEEQLQSTREEVARLGKKLLGWEPPSPASTGSDRESDS